MEQKTIYLIGAVVLFILAAVAIVLLAKSASESIQNDAAAMIADNSTIVQGATFPGGNSSAAGEDVIVAFAKCITSKGAAFYGADWCPHCQEQKKLFAQAVQYVNYTNCEANQQKCKDAGIEYYPTWVYNGQKTVGVQSFEKLAQMTGCSLTG